MNEKQYTCVKCGCHTYEADQFQATGGNFAKFFDIQNKKFVTVSCCQCGYTELYKDNCNDGSNILDFLFGD
ncbi:MAG: zinc ribbon domain-containing protein [Clostridia bacterium]|nr:zinc ribbon domain-containing protein [Clostridia bacterium]